MTREELKSMNPSMGNLIEEYQKQADDLRTELGEGQRYETEAFDAWIPMPDGVRLFAKIHRPKAGDRWPVIMIHNPYVFGALSNSIVDGSIFAEHGYIVINVNVRGTVLSEGEWTPFENRRQDGKAIIDWIGEQDWCDGNIGTYGGSYLGYTQWSIADYEHPMFKTMFIAVWGTAPYDLFHRRGLFRPDSISWSAQMMEDNRYRLRTGTENLELSRQAYEANPPMMLGEHLKGRHCDWYTDMVLAGRETDPYWHQGGWKELEEVVSRIKRPMYLAGGWFDFFLRSQINSYRLLPQAVRDRSRFVIGPWWHSCAIGGTLEYPEEKRYGAGVKDALKWFDYQLKRKEYPEKLGVIEAYNIGEGRWKVWKDDIVGNTTYTYYLDQAVSSYGNDGNGAENMADHSSERNGRAGSLGMRIPAEEQAISYIYDPANPVESMGGTLLSNNRNPEKPAECSTEQLAIGAREDVISFLSEPFEQGMCLAGQMEAQLYVESSVPATAFTVKVIEVFEDGRAMNIRDDITDIRWTDETHIVDYEPGTVRKLTLRLLDVSWTLKKGSRLRVDISSSNFPAYHIHPNTAKIWAEETKKVVAVETIYTGNRYPSCLILPVAE